MGKHKFKYNTENAQIKSKNWKTFQNWAYEDPSKNKFFNLNDEYQFKQEIRGQVDRSIDRSIYLPTYLPTYLPIYLYLSMNVGIK
jgi:hypothetical protein